jgi:hypothetical protein
VRNGVFDPQPDGKGRETNPEERSRNKFPITRRCEICSDKLSHELSLNFDVIAGHFLRRPSSRTRFLFRDCANVR